MTISASQHNRPLLLPPLPGQSGPGLLQGLLIVSHSFKLTDNVLTEAFFMVPIASKGFSKVHTCWLHESCLEICERDDRDRYDIKAY